MKGKALAVAFLATTMALVPLSTANPEGERWIEATEAEFEQLKADRLAELYAMWEAPSPLQFGDALQLLSQLHRGETLGNADGLALAQYLRDFQGTPTADALLVTWLQQTLNEGAVAIQDGHDPWQQSTWDDYGIVLTGAYLVGGTVNPELLPHNIRILGIYLNLDTAAGCNGGWSSGYCYLRVTADLLGLASLDIHATTDTAVAQFPLSLEAHVHWSCGWFGCSISVHLHTPQTVIATNAEFVFAYPAMSGEFASRATDHEILQMVYDALGTLDFQKPHGFTAAAPLAGTPVNSLVPGGTPGLADLHAVAPSPNYYGLQVPPEAPAKPGLPATPPQLDPARNAYNSLHTRVRDDFGTAPVDSTGVTVGFQMSQIQAWHLNLAIVRWKNIGTGTQGLLPEPPASFYYDAGSYLGEGGGNKWTVDYSIQDDLV